VGKEPLVTKLVTERFCCIIAKLLSKKIMSPQRNLSNNPKKDKKSGKQPFGAPALTGGQKFWSNLLTIFLLFFLVISIYSFVADSERDIEEIAISQLALDVSDGKVSEIIVRGEELEIIYTDDEEKRSKKESGTALTDTLVNYGVSLELLSEVSIDIQNPTGFTYWLATLGPFIFPLLLFILIIWFITRQVRGAGMQAFTFGQSKARFIDPQDKSQRITFTDVAGAKEAKEELVEIVDFLKNPKKFLNIGARIPKGIILMGAPGTGKCISGDTRLLTNKGLIPIDEIPKYFSVNIDNTVEGLEIISLNPSSAKLERARASHWYALGEQETVSLVTDTGLTIEGTQEHPVVVVDEKSGDFLFRRLDEVSEDDWIVSGYNTNVFGTYTKIPNSDVAYLMGVLTGDGCLTIKNRVILSATDPDILDRVQTIVRSNFDVSFKRTSVQSCDYELRSAEAKKQLIALGMQETYAVSKTVPEWIRLAPKEFVVAYMRGLFDADGSVEAKGSVTFSSSSQALVADMHVLLLNLGVVSRMYSRKKKYNNKQHFYLTVYGDFVERFSEEVSFASGRKKGRLEKLCQMQRNTNVNRIPCQQQAIKVVWDATKEATNVTLNRAFYAENLYKNTKRYISGERLPSRRGLQTFISSVSEMAPRVSLLPEVARLERLSSGDFFFTKVKKIGRGATSVYDLTVPHTHNFIAGGLINHNTLLARATAGEASVPFFSISGSEFVEMFVGVGASRVRDLFKMAKRAAPAIIFVDEIDAVGRVRGTGVGGGNDEREQTLNQILVEMDGFEPNEKVIVMAASNRPDVLDPALLRPGRFDRRVVIDLPDRSDREEILKIHARKKPFTEDVNLRTVAERTPGFSGADLQSLMNEGAILAARENRKQVAQYDLIRSIEKVMLGPERKSHLMSENEKKIVAYHESGHALVASVLPYADPVHKVTVIARGHAGGYTLKLPIVERKLQSRREFLDDIAVSLGGYVAERMIFGDITTGPSNDLQVATALARDMVTKYGMSDNLGPVALEGAGGRIVYGSKGLTEHEYSEEVSAKIDAEVSRIMSDAHKKAKKVLTDYRKALDAIAEKLCEVETLERDAFEDLLRLHGIEPKERKEESK
jgi:ATP-dependent metalloprotease FtsH